MSPSVATIAHVTSRHLCCGCGACASLHPDVIEMVDTLEDCRRPRQRDPLPVGVTLNGQLVDALRVCPGVHLAHDEATIDSQSIDSLRDGWGPVLQLWEGHAGDPEIRFAGSSGGAATALALYCLEREGMHGVLHTAARDDVPYLNHTVMSRTRDELLSRTGSRYAPSSPCDSLGEIEQAAGPCVFIGKPCDVAAALKMRRLRPQLDANLGVTIAFFCAGTPSTKGTLDLLKKAGVDDPATVRSIRYRGKGWPGRWTVEFAGASGEVESRSMSYEQSWGFLQKYRQWRCYICPDHTGEFADIAVGDPWYRKVEPGEAGSSLILARTKLGRAIIEGAISAGYLIAHSVQPEILTRSQPNLLKSRGSLWGRLLALRVAGAGVPRFAGMPMFRFWWSELSWREKVQSLVGTLRRVRIRGLRMGVEVTPL